MKKRKMFRLDQMTLDTIETRTGHRLLDLSDDDLLVTLSSEREAESWCPGVIGGTDTGGKPIKRQSDCDTSGGGVWQGGSCSCANLVNSC